MICLNLCDLLSEKNANERIFSDLLKTRRAITRLYIGSYFCSQYFLKVTWFGRLLKFCNENNLKVTLVVPVITEKDLKASKMAIDKMVECGKTVLDEITVNDPGMLKYIARTYKSLKINMGRLFFKYAREPRIAEYNHMCINVSEDLTLHVPKNKINYWEFDEITQSLQFEKKERMLAVHRPFCFITMGNICKFASLYKALDKKFRPNDICGMECQKLDEHYLDNKDTDVDLYRIGRTVYSYKSEKSELNIKADREIYFPFLEFTSMFETEEI